MVHHKKQVFAITTQFLLRIFGPFLFVLILIGCSKTVEYSVVEQNEGYYKNVVGSQKVKNQLEKGFESIRRLQNSVMYRTYQVNPELRIESKDMSEIDFETISVGSTVETISNAGTAMVLFNNGSKAMLLTAAHTVTQPDTVYHYSENQFGTESNLIKAVSVVVSINQFIITDNGIVGLEVLVIDENKDLALLGTTSEMEDQFNLTVLPIPWGDCNELSWSDMIYAVGYPRGVPMVTQGVVSLSNHPNRTLVFDLNVNRGFSGGAVFAVRSDGFGLEWIGMITSAMGERESYISPEELYHTEYSSDIPYEGALYVKNRSVIYYGIGYGVDISEIETFIRNNQRELRRQGINISHIL